VHHERQALRAGFFSRLKAATYKDPRARAEESVWKVATSFLSG